MAHDGADVRRRGLIEKDEDVYKDEDWRRHRAITERLKELYAQGVRTLTPDGLRTEASVALSPVDEKTYWDKEQADWAWVGYLWHQYMKDGYVLAPGRRLRVGSLIKMMDWHRYMAGPMPEEEE